MCTDLLNPVAGGDDIRAILVVERGRVLQRGSAGSQVLWGGMNQEMISSHRVLMVGMRCAVPQINMKVAKMGILDSLFKISPLSDFNYLMKLKSPHFSPLNKGKNNYECKKILW